MSSSAPMPTRYSAMSSHVQPGMIVITRSFVWLPEVSSSMIAETLMAGES